MSDSLDGLDLPVPVRVVMNTEGLRAFPQMKHRRGVARNYPWDMKLVRVKLDGQKQYETYSRSYWRLVK